MLSGIITALNFDDPACSVQCVLSRPAWVCIYCVYLTFVVCSLHSDLSLHSLFTSHEHFTACTCIIFFTLWIFYPNIYINICVIWWSRLFYDCDMPMLSVEVVKLQMSGDVQSGSHVPSHSDSLVRHGVRHPVYRSDRCSSLRNNVLSHHALFGRTCSGTCLLFINSSALNPLTEEDWLCFVYWERKQCSIPFEMCVTPCIVLLVWMCVCMNACMHMPVCILCVWCVCACVCVGVGWLGLGWGFVLWSLTMTSPKTLYIAYAFHSSPFSHFGNVYVSMWCGYMCFSKRVFV